MRSRYAAFALGHADYLNGLVRAGLVVDAVDELAAIDGVFAPRRLPELVATLVADGPPRQAVDTGV